MGFSYRTLHVMQRPVMDPLFVSPVKVGPSNRPFWGRGLLRGARWCGWQLLRSPTVSAAHPQPPVRQTLLAAFARMLLVLPLLPVMAGIILVYSLTHPSVSVAITDPSAQGLYYDPVSFVGADGVRLSGWLIPAIDAHRVLTHRDDILKDKRPAIVLAPDFAQSPQQLLPLLGPLHDDGYVLLAVWLRGDGVARPAGQTFGLNESQDVIAAADLLRRQPFVDSGAIALIGSGTGGSACALAAGRQSGVRAVVICGETRGPDEAILRPDFQRRSWFPWMRPLCKWTFNIAYGLEIEDLEKARMIAGVPPDALLQIRNPDGTGGFTPQAIGTIRQFLNSALEEPGAK